MTSRKNQLGISLCRAAFIFLLTIAPAIGFGQADARASAPLPPAAAEAVNKGIIAAKVPDYLLAIRYFKEARKLAPEAPVIYLNLGLAESKISGRELRAMAWFGAYLAVYPDAPNAAAVKEQIAVLDVRNQNNVLRLIKATQDEASQLPDNGAQLTSVAMMWADAGDIAGAQKTSDLIRHSLFKSRVLLYIAKAKIKKGDLAGARNSLESALKSADRIENEPHIGIASSKGAKNTMLAYIAKAQAECGDSVDAQKTFDRMDDEHYKSHYRSEFAKTGFPNAPNPIILPDIKISDWLRVLGDDNKKNEFALNTGPFLDLADYLKKFPYSGTHALFSFIEETAETIVSARLVISEILKQQARQSVKP